MAQERLPHRPSNHSSSQNPQLPPRWEKDLTEKFRQALSTRRMNDLSRRPSSKASQRQRTEDPSYRSETSPPVTSSPLPPRHGFSGNISGTPSSLDDFSLGSPPPPSSLRSLPIVPTPPVESSHRQFRNQLFMLSETPLKWENPGLLDEAMKSVPLEKIYSEAEEERAILQAQAESINKKPAWAWQDCVIRALLKWFKREFFTWVNNPPCSLCRAPTIAMGMCAPTAEEQALSGNRVELYKCSNTQCASFERFPRYNDAFVLLQTRRGRCGEWANCFTMLCRAMGSRVRWVWNSEDHVWTEVYSDYRKRWVHVDACEEAFDKPLLYAEGWGKKLGYCIGFGSDGAMDVTRRYCRNPSKHGVPRNKAPEAVLFYIMDEIRSMRRRDRNKDEKFRLEGEDFRETRELRHYYVSTLTNEVSKLMPLGQKSNRTLDADAQKAREGRQSGSAEWVRARGEDGQTGPRPQQDQPPR